MSWRLCGNCRGLIWGSISRRAWEMPWTMLVNMTGLRAELWYRNFRNKRQKCPTATFSRVLLAEEWNKQIWISNSRSVRKFDLMISLWLYRGFKYSLLSCFLCNVLFSAIMKILIGSFCTTRFLQPNNLYCTHSLRWDSYWLGLHISSNLVSCFSMRFSFSVHSGLGI
jgi:hypothetical protein